MPKIYHLTVPAARQYVGPGKISNANTNLHRNVEVFLLLFFVISVDSVYLRVYNWDNLLKEL